MSCTGKKEFPALGIISADAEKRGISQTIEWLKPIDKMALLDTSPCKICSKAFQHFLDSHVKSVRRLRKKGG